MYIIFDTETTGRWYRNTKIGDKAAPRIVELAVILARKDFSVAEIYSTYVKPIGFKIPEDATAIHHITTEQAYNLGVHPIEAIDNFRMLLSRADEDKEGYIVAHNLEYDMNVMLNEYHFHRIDPSHLGLYKPYCTMKMATNICKIPNPNPKYSNYKWPSLTEAYKFFCKKKYIHQHSALSDARVCLEIFKEMMNRKVEVENV